MQTKHVSSKHIGSLNNKKLFFGLLLSISGFCSEALKAETQELSVDGVSQKIVLPYENCIAVLTKSSKAVLSSDLIEKLDKTERAALVLVAMLLDPADKQLSWACFCGLMAHLCDKAQKPEYKQLKKTFLELVSATSPVFIELQLDASLSHLSESFQQVIAVYKNEHLYPKTQLLATILMRIERNISANCPPMCMSSKKEEPVKKDAPKKAAKK